MAKKVLWLDITSRYEDQFDNVSSFRFYQSHFLKIRKKKCWRVLCKCARIARFAREISEKVLARLAKKSETAAPHP